MNDAAQGRAGSAKTAPQQPVALVDFLHKGRHRRLGKKSRLLGSFANLWFAWSL
jgi:hypothetical protein